MNDDTLGAEMTKFAPKSIEKFEKNAIGQEYFDFIMEQ